jgi:hypothetical protein
MDLNSILYGGQANPQMSVPGVPAVPPGVLAGLQPQAPQMSMMVPQGMPAPEGVEPQQAPPQSLPQAVAPEASAQSIFDKIRSDPKMAQAALMAGIRLAQGAKPGQTALGLVGDAMMMGLTAHDMLAYNETQQGMQKEKHQADMARSAAATEGQQLQNEESRSGMPDRLQVLKTKAEALLRAGELEKAQQVYNVAKAEFQNAALKSGASTQIQNAWLQELTIPALERQAKLNLLEQQAGASAASARSSDAHANLFNQQASNPEKFRSDGSESSVVKAANHYAMQLRAQGLPEDQVAGKVAEFMSGKKPVDPWTDFNNWVSQNNISVSKPGEMEKATKQYWEQRRALEGGKAPGGPTPAASTASSAPATKGAKTTPGSPESTRQDILKLMETMPELKGMSVGSLTGQGWEIKDPSGKLVGHFR